MKINRLALATALFTLAASLHAAELKYIFYFIGDGMGMGHVMAADAYNRQALKAPEHMLMMQFPVASQCTTHSADSYVTDSSAAGTALATGHKTNNGMIGMKADTVAVESIAERLHRQGWGVGIITTDDMDQATPSVFFAHVPSRSMLYEIDSLAALCDFEFIAGRNMRGASGKHRHDQPKLDRLFADNGVSVVRTLNDLARTDSRRVMLLNKPEYSRSYNYTIDSVPGLIELPAMLDACMNHLQRHTPNHWFIMAENGKIDHAAHGNDAATTLRDVLHLDHTLRQAYDFYLAHPDETLIIVTGDHETGGLGMSNNHLGYKLKLDLLTNQKISKDSFTDYCHQIMKADKKPSWEEMQSVLTDKFGFWKEITLNSVQTERLKNMYDKAIKLRKGTEKKTLYKTFDQFSEVVYTTLDEVSGLGWTSNHHTGGLTPVYAIGVGAERFANFNDNTDLPRKILEIVESTRKGK